MYIEIDMKEYYADFTWLLLEGTAGGGTQKKELGQLKPDNESLGSIVLLTLSYLRFVDFLSL